MSKRKTRVVWTVEEIDAMARTFIARFKQRTPTRDTLYKAMVEALPRERWRNDINAGNRKNASAVLRYCIASLQGHPEHASNLFGEWGEYSQRLLRGLASLSLSKAVKEVKSDAPMLPGIEPEAEPVAEPEAEAEAEADDRIDDLLSALSGAELSNEHISRLISMISTEELVVEVERRRYRHIESIRGDTSALFELMSEIGGAPKSAPPPFTRNEIAVRQRKRRVTIVTNTEGSRLLPIVREVTNLDVRVVAKDRVGLADMHHTTDAIIVLAKFVSHSTCLNAKSVASDRGLPYFELHGTGALNNLLRSMNRDSYWAE